jgi:Tetratricopeptide repeat.
MKNIILSAVLIGIILPLPALTQDSFQYKKDSILRVIPALAGKARLDAYENLGRHLFYQESDTTGILLIFKAWEKEAEKQGDVKLQRRVMYLTLGALINRRYYDSFLKEVEGVLSFAEQHNLYDEHYYAIHNSRLSALYELGRLQESLQGAKDLYTVSKENNRPMGQTTALFRMGEIYSNLRRFTEAEKCYRECLDLLDGQLSTAHTSIDCYFGLVELLLVQKRIKKYLMS